MIFKNIFSMVIIFVIKLIFLNQEMNLKNLIMWRVWYTKIPERGNWLTRQILLGILYEMPNQMSALLKILWLSNINISVWHPIRDILRVCVSLVVLGQSCLLCKDSNHVYERSDLRDLKLYFPWRGNYRPLEGDVK